MRRKLNEKENKELIFNWIVGSWLLAGQHNLFTPLYFIVVEAILFLSAFRLMFGVGFFTKLQSLQMNVCAPVHKILFDLQNIFRLSMAKDCITLMVVGKVLFSFLIHAKHQ